MRTIWHQHYFSAILAMAVALALPWHCIVHCAPQMQPSRHSQFVCDMTQTTPTITSNQHQFTSATPRLKLSAVDGLQLVAKDTFSLPI